MFYQIKPAKLSKTLKFCVKFKNGVNLYHVLPVPMMCKMFDKLKKFWCIC